MIQIRVAKDSEFSQVRSFYHTLIDMMKNAQYKPGWEKGVYPSDDYLRQALGDQELYLCLLDDHMAGAMIVNHKSNDGYTGVRWSVNAKDNEVTVIHALGVLPTFSGRGLAKEMVRTAITMAKEKQQKTIRLDVLSGNRPAEKLYAGIGFQYVGTVNMFYEDTGWTDFLLYEYLI